MSKCQIVGNHMSRLKCFKQSSDHWCTNVLGTVKPVLNNHSKVDKTNIVMKNGRLMKVKSIAECSHWSILQYFDLH